MDEFNKKTWKHEQCPVNKEDFPILVEGVKFPSYSCTVKCEFHGTGECPMANGVFFSDLTPESKKQLLSPENRFSPGDLEKSGEFRFSQKTPNNWSEISSADWLQILLKYPALEMLCPEENWNRFSEKEWLSLLMKNPAFLPHCSSIYSFTPSSICELLLAVPEMHSSIDLAKLDAKTWNQLLRTAPDKISWAPSPLVLIFKDDMTLAIDLLLLHPEFKNQFPTDCFGLGDLVKLLREKPAKFQHYLQPEFKRVFSRNLPAAVELLKEKPFLASGFPLEILDRESWLQLIPADPTFYRLFSETGMELTKEEITGILLCRPELANPSLLEKLDEDHWCKLLQAFPELREKSDRWKELLTPDQWCELILSHPDFLTCCPILKLTGDHWCMIVEKHKKAVQNSCPPEILTDENWHFIRKHGLSKFFFPITFKNYLPASENAPDECEKFLFRNTFWRILSAEIVFAIVTVFFAPFPFNPLWNSEVLFGIHTSWVNWGLLALAGIGFSGGAAFCISRKAVRFSTIWGFILLAAFGFILLMSSLMRAVFQGDMYILCAVLLLILILVWIFSKRKSASREIWQFSMLSLAISFLVATFVYTAINRNTLHHMLAAARKTGVQPVLLYYQDKYFASQEFSSLKSALEKALDSNHIPEIRNSIEKLWNAMPESDLLRNGSNELRKKILAASNAETETGRKEGEEYLHIYKMTVTAEQFKMLESQYRKNVRDRDYLEKNQSLVYEIEHGNFSKARKIISTRVENIPGDAFLLNTIAPLLKDKILSSAAEVRRKKQADPLAVTIKERDVGEKYLKLYASFASGRDDFSLFEKQYRKSLFDIDYPDHCRNLQTAMEQGDFPNATRILDQFVQMSPHDVFLSTKIVPLLKDKIMSSGKMETEPRRQTAEKYLALYARVTDVENYHQLEKEYRTTCLHATKEALKQKVIAALQKKDFSVARERIGDLLKIDQKASMLASDIAPILADNTLKSASGKTEAERLEGTRYLELYAMFATEKEDYKKLEKEYNIELQATRKKLIVEEFKSFLDQKDFSKAESMLKMLQNKKLMNPLLRDELAVIIKNKTVSAASEPSELTRHVGKNYLKLFALLGFDEAEYKILEREYIAKYFDILKKAILAGVYVDKNGEYWEMGGREPAVLEIIIQEKSSHWTDAVSFLMKEGKLKRKNLSDLDGSLLPEKDRVLLGKLLWENGDRTLKTYEYCSRLSPHEYLPGMEKGIQAYLYFSEKINQSEKPEVKERWHKIRTFYLETNADFDYRDSDILDYEAMNHNIDQKTRFHFMRKHAAEKGYLNAQISLADDFYYGQNDALFIDYEKALYWYKKAAQRGNPHAQFKIGLMYYNGKGVIQNAKQADYWFRLAAEQGHAEAKSYIGDVEQKKSH